MFPRVLQGRVIRGFVVFETAEGCRQGLARSYEMIGPRSVEVTIATTKGTMQAGSSTAPTRHTHTHTMQVGNSTHAQHTTHKLTPAGQYASRRRPY